MNSNVKKGVKNISYGFLGQLISLIIGLIVPRLILVNYGSESNGLISSIGQIFAYVALLEAGVGGATTQALYSPVAKNDKESISSILSATNIYYRRTGIIYVFAVVGLALFYPLIVPTELSYFVVFGIIIFNGMGGAINFLFQGKYYLLLTAEGKDYVQMNLTTALNVISSIAKVVLILLGVNIVTLQFAYFLINIAQMLFVVIYIKKNYPWLNVKSKPDYAAISQKNSVMVHQVSSLIFGNTDSLILTFFCGLKSVSVYSMPGLFIGCVDNLIRKISQGILFSLGQSFHTSREKFMKIYNSFETFFYAAVSFSSTMIFLFLNPIIALYTKGVTDIQYINKFFPFLFTFLYWLSCARVPSIYVVNNCAGHFKQTAWRSVLESSINIVVSLVGVIKFGMYGVIIGTIVALLYRTNDMIIYSAKYILNRSLWMAYKRLLVNGILTIINIIIGKCLIPKISNYFEWVLYAFIFAVPLLVVFIGVNYLISPEEVKSIFKLLFNIFRHKNQ